MIYRCTGLDCGFLMEDEDGKLYITDGVMDDFINMNNTANIQEIKTK